MPPVEQAVGSRETLRVNVAARRWLVRAGVSRPSGKIGDDDEVGLARLVMMILDPTLRGRWWPWARAPLVE